MFTVALPYKNNTNKYKLFVLILLCKNKLVLNFFRLIYEIIKLDTNFYFPKNIKTITSYFFPENSTIKKVIIPNTVRKIMPHVFRCGSNSLKSLFIPKSVVLIDCYAFHYSILEELIFENSDTGKLYIKDYAFYYGSCLQVVKIDRKNLILSENSFNYLTKVYNIHKTKLKK